MHLRDLGTRAGLLRTIRELPGGTVRHPLRRLAVNLLAVIVLGAMWLAAVLSRLS